MLAARRCTSGCLPISLQKCDTNCLPPSFLSAGSSSGATVSSFWRTNVGCVWMCPCATGYWCGGRYYCLSGKDECRAPVAFDGPALLSDNQLYGAGCAHAAQPRTFTGNTQQFDTGELAKRTGSHDHADGSALPAQNASSTPT